MIARVDGQVVLVSGAIPGERVEARIERVTKGVALAETIGVLEPSPDRREPFVDPLCGGSLFSYIAYPRQLALKSEIIADAFKRIGRLELPGTVAVAASPEDGYRMRARLHVRAHTLGFFREGTHEICGARATRQIYSEARYTVGHRYSAGRKLFRFGTRRAGILCAGDVRRSQRCFDHGRRAVRGVGAVQEQFS